MQLNGLLLVDKPADVTSHDVVARLRKIVGQRSIGHTGTLDPLATGLMVTVLGDATKLSDYLIAEDKGYCIDVRLGVETDTLDRTGQIVRQADVDHLDEPTVRDAVATLAGDFEWPVPLFSATKIDGRKLYEYGRAGEAVERPVKTMSFRNVHLDSYAGGIARVTLECSKGSFVRSWASELGARLGDVGGSIEELRRWRVGGWDVRQAITLDQLAEATRGESRDVVGAAGAAFVPMAGALPGLRSVMASDRDVRLVGHGQIPRDIETRLVFEQKEAFAQNRSVFVKVISNTGDLLAILAAEPGRGLKIRRVFRGFN